MRKTNEQPLKEVLARLVKTYQLEGKLNEVEIIRSWKSLMGPTISNKTEKIFIQKKCLYLKISSAPLKQELFFAREKIKNRLNEKIGKNLIDMVVLI